MGSGGQASVNKYGSKVNCILLLQSFGMGTIKITIYYYTAFPHTTGLCGRGISFQLRRTPDAFVVAGMPDVDMDPPNFAGYMPFEDTTTYRSLACWTPHESRVGSNYITFESIWTPGRYIYYRGADVSFTTEYDDLSTDFA